MSKRVEDRLLTGVKWEEVAVLRDLIRQYREDRGIDKEEMARKLGLSYMAYHRFEKGIIADWDWFKVQLAADILGVSVESLRTVRLVKPTGFEP
jgi:DNA-binding XRE family transcriptional regulator